MFTLSVFFEFLVSPIHVHFSRCLGCCLAVSLSRQAVAMLPTSRNHPPSPTSPCPISCPSAKRALVSLISRTTALKHRSHENFPGQTCHADQYARVPAAQRHTKPWPTASQSARRSLVYLPVIKVHIVVTLGTIPADYKEDSISANLLGTMFQTQSQPASECFSVSCLGATMCHYYCMSFCCRHLEFTFARFCPEANLIQTPCGRRKVWQTIFLEQACEECLAWFPEKYMRIRSRTA